MLVPCNQGTVFDMADTGLMYHHSRELKSIVYGELSADSRYYDPFFKDAYVWLEKEVGFSPLFLAVGQTIEDIRMTGYQDNWRRKVSTNEYRRAGNSPNHVLFSFDALDGVFMDYSYWHIVLNANHKNYRVSNYETRLIFKPSWEKNRWLRYAKQHPHSVQLVRPNTDLRKAGRIWTRNNQTKTILEGMEFKNIKVKRIRL